ncbi:hypothetical protein EYZ11_007784 [Aspergillus tanneri]|uniref:TLC domain-containing protein n=1 Tax=Aspergillus tanneri TaxID=1220188 RepID=A0A4S3JC49_9EURO|nr:uncharacterized protein ATNIH1004_006675 [Aspergillus tanneri]KAA8645256.1 hypothetical protein ATNIH1004_006675 [Aspergillus tanneri]THC92736.1 hypothetical protein EYZ11_007784 [Aspergillus tanneri]
MSSFDDINSNGALALSATTYPIIFRLMTPTNSTAARFMKSRELISVFHCIITLSATLFELHRQFEKWAPPPRSPLKVLFPWLLDRDTSTAKDSVRGLSYLDIVDAMPPFTHTILAFECGYLIQDFALLILGTRRVAGDSRAKSVMARNVNWRVLGWHHLGIACGLGLFHLRALRGQAKASLVMLMMMLMNASTPIGTLHWYLVNFHRSWRSGVCITYGAYLATYAVARVYLLYWILSIYGSWTGQSAIEAFRHLRWQCQLGTGIMGTTNTFWLLIGLRKFIKQYLTSYNTKRTH